MPSGLEEAELLLLDPAQRVVFTSGGLDFEVLQNLSESPLVRTEEGPGPEGIIQVTLAMALETGEEPIDVTYVVHRTVGARGWTVCGLVPLSRVHGGLETFYMLSILGVFLALTLAVTLARRLADRVTVPLAGLLDRVRRFRIDGTPTEPPTELLEAPREIHQLAQDFDELCQRLIESYADLEESLEERERLNGELQVLLTELDTKVKQRTAQLTTEKARAEEASQAKSRFLASTSHEIRTPLSGIISLTELLLEESLEERPRRFATAILSSAETLLGILDDVLDFSKIEAGKLHLERVEFGLRSLLEGVHHPARAEGSGQGSSSAVPRGTVGAATIRRRSGPAAAGLGQPRGQCGEVHRTRRDLRWCGASREPGGDLLDPLGGAGYGHRHRRRGGGAAVRTLCAERFLHQSTLRRHRFGAHHL